MKLKLLIAFIFISFTACETGNDDNTILKFYGDALEDVGYSIAIAEDGYVICGQMTEVTRRDGNYIVRSKSRPAVIKTGFDGNTIWQKYLGEGMPGIASKVIVLDDGTIVCAGQITDTLNSQTDIFVAKMGSDGSATVPVRYGYEGNQLCNDIIKTPEGFLLLGTTDVERVPVSDSTGNRAGKLDILLVRLDNNLVQIDDPMPCGFGDNDIGAAIKIDPEGGYIVCGSTERYKSKGHKNDIFIIKVNNTCTAIDYSIIGTTSDEYSKDMEVLSDGFLITGVKGSEAEKQSLYMLKVPVDIHADPLIPDNPVQDISWSVKAMSRYKNNYFVIAGQAGSASSSKMLVFMVDYEGNIVEGKELMTGSTGVQCANDVVSDINNNIITVGKNSYESDSMITLLKFSF